MISHLSSEMENSRKELKILISPLDFGLAAMLHRGGDFKRWDIILSFLTQFHIERVLLQQHIHYSMVAVIIPVSKM